MGEAELKSIPTLSPLKDLQLKWWQGLRPGPLLHLGEDAIPLFLMKRHRFPIPAVFWSAG